MDDNTISFVELIALTRITPESTVERFGSLINSSFFDASNILATLKQKGLVDFMTAFPSQSTLKVTDLGNSVLAEARQKGSEPLDALDTAIMVQLSNGRRGLNDLNGSINVTQKDLAMHLFKLGSQQQISYELANANVNIYLTEKGFLAVRSSGQAPQMAPPPSQTPNAPAQGGGYSEQGYTQTNVSMTATGPLGMGPMQSMKTGEDSNVIEELIKKSKARKRKRLIMIVVLGVVAVVLILVLFTLLHL